MRTSLAITALITAPLFFTVACTDGSHTAPAKAAAVKGTVVDKEYGPAKKKTTKEPVKTRVCSSGREGKKTCRTVVVRYRTVTRIVEKECYELEIRLADGSTTEVCNKAAYDVLNVTDRYSSAIDYSRKAGR